MALGAGYLLSSRSRVRVALGAQRVRRRSDQVSPHTLMIFTMRSVAFVPVVRIPQLGDFAACPGGPERLTGDFRLKWSCWLDTPRFPRPIWASPACRAVSDLETPLFPK